MDTYIKLDNETNKDGVSSYDISENDNRNINLDFENKKKEYEQQIVLGKSSEINKSCSNEPAMYNGHRQIIPKDDVINQFNKLKQQYTKSAAMTHKNAIKHSMPQTTDENNENNEDNRTNLKCNVTPEAFNNYVKQREKDTDKFKQMQYDEKLHLQNLYDSSRIKWHIKLKLFLKKYCSCCFKNKEE